MNRRTAIAIVVTGILVAAWAGPAWAGSSDSGAALALPRPVADPTPSFGFAGPKPLVTDTPTGIARPTPPPPVIETTSFGCARIAMPVRAKLDCSSGYCVECSDERPLTATGEVSRPTCDPCTGCGPCDPCSPCSPCGPRPVYAPPGCETIPQSRRISTDTMSIPPAFWSSGYHDGCPPARPVCTPSCPPPCPTPCAPCPPVRRVVRRCDPCPTVCAPAYAPCPTVCDPCPPRRFVVRRRCAPVRVRYVSCATPCGPCGPSWGCAPYGPRRGWGCGPCAPRYGSCGPCGIAPAAAAVGAVGIGLGLAALACGCGCW